MIDLALYVVYIAIIIIAFYAGAAERWTSTSLRKEDNRYAWACPHHGNFKPASRDSFGDFVHPHEARQSRAEESHRHGADDQGHVSARDTL
jgi:hypothetical protein